MQNTIHFYVTNAEKENVKCIRKYRVLFHSL